MDQLLKIAEHHFLAVPAVVAFVAAVAARLDAVILFALRFFKPETIKAELDKLNALAKARVDADAAKLAAAPLGGGAPNAQQAPSVAPEPGAGAPTNPQP